MANDRPSAGTKRAHSTPVDEQGAMKRRRVHRKLLHVQPKPQNIEPAPQDPNFAQAQLLRSITAALAIAGFEGVERDALEMFRSHTEEYISKLLSYVKNSMLGGRRTRPVANDFSMAFSLMPNTFTASLLTPQLDLPLPEEIACPSIADPDPPLAPAPDFSALLRPLMEEDSPAYIPAHFPQLPPRHAYKSTAVFSKREHDSRKMREKATQEGMMAEQALRRLATAAKAGALKAERRRSSVLSGPGKVVKRKRDHEDTFADVMKDIGGLDGTDEMAVDDEEGNAHEDGVDVGMPEGVVVNYEMGHWRHGGARKALIL